MHFNAIRHIVSGDDKNEICSLHEKAREAKKTKDRYIEEGLEKVNQIGKKRKKLDHPAEELFTDYNQTVLIWCFSDFVRDRKISEVILLAVLLLLFAIWIIICYFVYCARMLCHVCI